MPETPLAIVNYTFGRLLGHLLEDINNDDRVRVYLVNDAPRLIPVNDAQLVAPSTDIRHRARVW